MNPSQKDDDGQEWEPWNAEHLTDEQRAKIQTVPWWAIRDGYSRLALVWAEVDKDAILADHRDAQQLREQVEQERHYKRQANQQSASLAVEKIALEERVRLLEEALREADKKVCNLIAAVNTERDVPKWLLPIFHAMNQWQDDYAEVIDDVNARTLLSPAADTEGGEGA